jgi:transketolase
MRLGRIPTAVVTSADTPFELGKANVMRSGDDVAIISTGSMVVQALEAATLLAKRGLEARIINMHTVKPLDRQTLSRAAEECGAVVTVEEHSILGGLGGAVSEYLAQVNPIPIEMVGIKDTFGESGPPQILLEKYGLTTETIVTAAERAINRRYRHRGC